jgi:hypothetical protein
MTSAPARPDAPKGAQQGSYTSEPRQVAPADAPPRPDGPDFETSYIDHLEEENSFLREQNTVLLDV